MITIERHDPTFVHIHVPHLGFSLLGFSAFLQTAVAIRVRCVPFSREVWGDEILTPLVWVFWTCFLAVSEHIFLTIEGVRHRALRCGFDTGEGLWCFLSLPSLVATTWNTCNLDKRQPPCAQARAS